LEKCLKYDFLRMFKVLFLFFLVDITTVFVNVSIKKKWWKIAGRLIEFKKVYLACKLRKLINYE